MLDGRPELDLMSGLLAVPERGIKTLLDLAPAVFDADWAEPRAPVRRLPVLYATSMRPHDDLAPDRMPIRALVAQTGDCVCAYLPIQPLRSVLVLSRDDGPPFLRAELANGERIVDLAVKILERVLTSTSSYGS